MKQWIVRHLTAYYAVTGKAVPGWIRRLVSEEEFRRIQQAETDLTAALNSQSDAGPSLPEALRQQIEAEIAEGQTRHEAIRPRSESVFPVWAIAAAAVLLIGVSLYVLTPSGGVFIAPDSGEVATAEEIPPVDPQVAQPETFLAKEGFARDILLQPLAEEQARLASDMTNAIQFMASSLLPAEYATRVEKNLDTLERELIESI